MNIKMSRAWECGLPTITRGLSNSAWAQNSVLARCSLVAFLICLLAGSSWGAVTFSAFAIDPTNPSVMYVGTRFGSKTGNTAGVFKSTNGGLSWKSINKGLTNLWIKTMAIDPLNPQNIYVGTVYGERFYKSANGGGSWKTANKGAAADFKTYGVALVLVDHFIPQSVYAILGPCYAPGWPIVVDYIYRSTDGAKTWKKVSLPAYCLVHWAGIDPKTPNVLYVAADPSHTRNYLYRSPDGGETWSKLGAIPSAIIDLRDLIIDPKNTKKIYVYDSSNSFRSLDGGKTWIRMDVTTGGFCSLAVSPVNPTVLYGADAYGLFKSIDSGKSWQDVCAAVRVALHDSIFLHPRTLSTVYASVSWGECFLYRSTDGGKSWTRMPVISLHDTTCDETIACE